MPLSFDFQINFGRGASVEKILLRLAISFLAVIPAFAFASIKMDLKPYVDFALEWTSYSYHGEPLPKIKLERHQLVQIFAYGDYEYAQAESKGVELPTVYAIYLADEKTIYISDQLPLNDKKIDVTLAHEMVHYLQDINGYTRSLNGHTVCSESEAYDVQMLWQKIKNVDPESIQYVYQRSTLAAIECMGSKGSAFHSAMQN